MANAQLAVKNLSGTPQVVRVSGTTPTNVGGPIRRATALGGTWVEKAWGAARQLGAESFCVQGRRSDSSQRAMLYRLNPNAQALIFTGALTGTLPLAGDLVTGDTSGATGRIIEDAFTGDDFACIESITGTFQASEGVTFSEGGSGSGSGTNATATLAGSGFLEDNSGEWGNVDGQAKSTSPPFGEPSYSPLFPCTLPNGRSGLMFMADNNSSLDLYLYDPVDGLTKSASGLSSSFEDMVEVHGCILGNRMVLTSVGQSGADVRIFEWNTDSGSGIRFDSNLVDKHQRSVCPYRGSIYMSSYDSASSGARVLSRVDGGGVLTIVKTIANGTTTAGSLTVHVGPGGLVLGDDDALYQFIGTDQATGRRLLARYSIDPDTNSLILGCLSNDMDDPDIGEALLPASIRDGTDDDFGVAMLVDMETDPANPTTRWFYYSGDAVSPIEFSAPKPTAIDSGNTATISGSTVTFQNAHNRSVGDWIRHRGSNKIFRVATTPTSTTLTLDTTASTNEGWALPVDESAWDYYSEIVQQSASGSLAGFGPADERVGGGDSIFISGEPGSFKYAAEGGGQGTIILTELFDGGGQVTASVYFWRDGDEDSPTLASLTSGTQAGASPTVFGKKIQNINADGINPVTLVLDAESAGIQSGEIINYMVRREAQ